MKFKIQNSKFKILGFFLAFLTFTFFLLTFSSPVYAACSCAPNADYGDLADKTAWCACAASCNDAGSLQAQSCPQAQTGTCAAGDCSKCTPTTTCGNQTYTSCDTSTCKKPGDTFKCWAPENPTSCSYSSYPCNAACIAANSGGSGGSGGAGGSFICNSISTTPSSQAQIGTPVTINAGGSVTNYPDSSMSKVSVWIKPPNQGFTQVGSPINCSGSTQSCSGSVTWNTASLNNGPGSYTISERLINTNGGERNSDGTDASCNTTYTLTQAAGGTPPAPPSAGAPKGSECVSYQIIDSTTKDVTAGPIYENEKYVFKLTFKNKATTGEPQPWTKATHKLQAIGNTAAAWATQATYPLTKDTVTKDNIEVFNIDATAGLLPEGKNFEERPFHYSMADQGGPFGAICERNITVLKKPAGLSTTKCYVISEDASEIDNVKSCDDPKARTYTAHPTNLSYPFKTPLVAGTPRTIYVKFFDNEGKSSGTPFTKTIVYTPPAALSGVDCSYDSSSLATTYTIRGTSLGAQTANTKVKVGNADAVVTGWTATTITAKVDSRVEGSSSVSVSLEDGKKLDGTCAVGTTTATLSVKNKCATADTVNTDDVEVSIYESGTQPFIKQKVRPDKDGNLQGFVPKLEKNKKYTALFKKAGFLTKKVEFNTTSGTAVAEAAVLIPGDIAPRAAPDNVINSFDVSELKTQWDLVKDVTRTGDLNRDNRVNSFDWSCMKSSSNQQGDIFTGSSSTAPPPAATSGNRVVPISGKIFFDANSDSKFTTGETLVPSVTVKALRPAAPEVAGQTLTAAQAAAATVLGQTQTDANGSYSMSVTMPAATLNLVIWVDPGSQTGQGGQSAIGIGAFAADFFQTHQLVMDIPLRQ